MEDGLMQGMVFGALLLSAPPLLLAFGIGIYVLRRHRSEKGERSPGAGAAPRPLSRAAGGDEG